MLTFDQESHTYRWNGAVVPSVTQILRPLMDLDAVDPDVLRRASAFGTAVHLACELDDKGTLDESALDPALAPYLAGWRQFSKDYGCRWEALESRVYHSTLRYAGTLDRRGTVGGHQAYVDIKSGTSLYHSVGPQLAAYAAADCGIPGARRRYAVRLDPRLPAGYELQEYTDPRDWPVFASLITLRGFCQQHRITCKEISYA